VPWDDRVIADKMIDRLYGLPPEEFVRARDLMARELRADGQRADAERVKELRKPTAAAAAANRLVREHRADVKRFLSAADALRKAQLAGRDLAKPTQRERETLDKLVGAGGDHVRQSLQAAAVDADAANQLLEARLERELEPRGFGTLLGEATRIPTGASKKTPAPAIRKHDDRAARAKLADARRVFAEAQARERHANHALKQAQAAVRKAEAEVLEAERDLAALHVHSGSGDTNQVDDPAGRAAHAHTRPPSS
jgi:hypothetical protein